MPVIKVASGFDKHVGLTVVPPSEEAAFIAALPIGEFRGVGPVTEEKMRGLGVMDGMELRAKSEAYLQEHFGKRGRFFYRLAQGEDDCEVRPGRESKSVAHRAPPAKRQLVGSSVWPSRSVPRAERGAAEGYPSSARLEASSESTCWIAVVELRV